MPSATSFAFAGLLTSVIVAMAPLEARAEYRAFLLVITNQQTGQSRNVTSTLDDIQYRGYYPIRHDETVVIQDTWMCWGTHGEGVHYCPSPHVQDPSGATATTGKNVPAPTASSPGTRAPASSPR